MDNIGVISSRDAYERLRSGNERYVLADRNEGDVSKERRAESVREGQKPYAVIVTCSDSRVIPESIFTAGIGELFVIRVAGNVIGDMELASIEYAVEHLGCPLTVVLGHTHCGALHSAMGGKADGNIGVLIDKILSKIGGERDEARACRINVSGSIADIENGIKNANAVIGAIYDTESGRVEFFDTANLI